MNCKPGDLAIIVRAGVGASSCLGKIIRVLKVKPEVSAGNGPTWSYSPKVKRNNGTPVSLVNDCCLRPIRNPGDDADCESKAWLPPVPTHSKELA